MRTILYVCTGNTCRSPMAEAMTRHWLASGELGDAGEIFVASAGVMAAEGSPTTAETILALKNQGVEHDGRSKPLTGEMIRRAEVLLCMTRGQLDAAQSLVALDEGVNTKLALLNPQGDIQDPIGQGQAAYDALVETLLELIPRRLKEMLGHEDRAGV